MTEVPPPDRPTSTRLEAHALRVLAHPLRSRLLSELRREGAATATELAHRLQTNTGATSYHLRKLAEVGLVEAAAGGVGRERRWQAAHEMHSWSASDTGGDPDSEAASAWLLGEGLRNFTKSAEHWLRTETGWPMAWRDVGGASDYLLRLSPEQLQALLDELYAVVERYRTAEPGPDAHRIYLYLHTFPQTDLPQTDLPQTDLPQTDLPRTESPGSEPS